MTDRSEPLSIDLGPSRRWWDLRVVVPADVAVHMVLLPAMQANHTLSTSRQRPSISYVVLSACHSQHGLQVSDELLRVPVLSRAKHRIVTDHEHIVGRRLVERLLDPRQLRVGLLLTVRRVLHLNRGSSRSTFSASMPPELCCGHHWPHRT